MKFSPNTKAMRGFMLVDAALSAFIVSITSLLAFSVFNHIEHIENQQHLSQIVSRMLHDSAQIWEQSDPRSDLIFSYDGSFIGISNPNKATHSRQLPAYILTQTHSPKPLSHNLISKTITISYPAMAHQKDRKHLSFYQHHYENPIQKTE